MNVLVLGRGRVGTAVSTALRERGIDVRLEPGTAEPPAADLTLLCVPDDAVGATAQRLAAVDLPPAAFAHCSGALDLDPLEPLSNRGHDVGAWHPLQAFATRRTPLREGITWAITGSEPLAGRLTRLTLDVGGRPLLLAAGDRARYHAAAVLAANYCVTLIAHAAAQLGECGLSRDDALRALLPLVSSTLDGLAVNGLPDGLTGPAVRGDVGTIARHLSALGHGAAADLYRACGLATLGLVTERGVGPEVVERLRILLTDAVERP